MKKITIVSFVVVLLAGAAVGHGQEMPEMPKPQKEHEWLQQLVGDWETESEMNMPGEPPITAKGTENARMIGGFWLVAEGDATVMDMPMKSIFTLGYDPQKKKYVGNWIDSVTGYYWKYVGEVDDADKTLTLATEGPCPMRPGELSKFKEVLELKDKDHKVFTSSVQEKDGSWIKMMTANYRRKK